MPQSDGINQLKRMAIEFKDATYNFAINPQEYTQEEPSRSTVTQTKAGAWVDDFGGGLPTIYIKGTTGFLNGLGEGKFKELRDMVRRYYDSHSPGDDVKDEMIFHNYTDGESWIVHTDPAGLKLLRSKSNPLSFMYEMKFICLRRAQDPAPEQLNVAQSGVGNPFGSSLPGSETVANTAQTQLYEYALPYLKSNMSLSSGSVPKTFSSYVSDLRFLSNGQLVLSNNGLLSATPSNFVYATMTPQVSNLAIDTFRALTTLNSPVITTANLDKNSLLYDIVYLSRIGLDANTLDVLKAVALESVAITMTLMSNPSDLSSKLSESNLDNIVGNIRCVIDNLYHAEIDYLILEKLRWLERALIYVKQSLQLFRQNPSENIIQYNLAKGGAS